MTWASMRWQDVCILKYGKALKDYKHFNQAYPVYGSGGVVGSTDTPIAPGERVIVSRKGTLTAYWSSAPSHVIDTAFWLEPNPVLDAKWSYYAIKNLDISTLSSGSGVPSLSRDDFYREELLLPPLKQQKAIAHILGTLDDKIELNQKMNQTLEEIAKAIFKSWFVDFDPVRAKSEGRPTGLPSEISDLFPDELVDSEIGEIPKGWSESTFGELADIQNGYAFKSKDWNEEGTIPVVKIGNVKPMLVDVESCSRVDSQTVAGLERFRLSSGDALIGMTGYVGEVGLVPKVNELPYLNQRVGRLIAQAPSDYSFMVVMTRRKEFKLEVENLGTGSAQANVSASSIKSIKVVAPSSDLKEKFGEVINPIIDRILTAAAEIEVLSELRDTLLPKLISGELRIPDAKKFLEEAGI